MDCQRIWLSLGVLALGVMVSAQDEANAVTRIKRPVARSYVQQQTVSCPLLPAACGVVTAARGTRCPAFWYVHLAGSTRDTCTNAAANDVNFSNYVVCGRMYRNAGRFAEWRYT